jgi:hypothetical protein
MRVYIWLGCSVGTALMHRKWVYFSFYRTRVRLEIDSGDSSDGR